MVKKLIIMLLLIVSLNTVSLAETVTTTDVEVEVAFNGYYYKDESYPLLKSGDYIYFPLTFDLTRSLGLSLTVDDNLKIKTFNQAVLYQSSTADQVISTAVQSDKTLMINDEIVDEKVLVYGDIYYLPLKVSLLNKLNLSFDITDFRGIRVGVSKDCKMILPKPDVITEVFEFDSKDIKQGEYGDIPLVQSKGIFEVSYSSIYIDVSLLPNKNPKLDNQYIEVTAHLSTPDQESYCNKLTHFGIQYGDYISQTPGQGFINNRADVNKIKVKATMYSEQVYAYLDMLAEDGIEVDYKDFEQLKYQDLKAEGYPVVNFPYINNTWAFDFNPNLLTKMYIEYKFMYFDDFGQYFTDFIYGTYFDHYSRDYSYYHIDDFDNMYLIDNYGVDLKLTLKGEPVTTEYKEAIFFYDKQFNLKKIIFNSGNTGKKRNYAE